MKKYIIVYLLVFMMLVGVCSVSFADTGASTDPVQQAAMSVAITTGVKVVGSLLITLIGALGAWLTVKIGKYRQLQNINLAINEVVKAAKTTVGELQQTVVDGLKAKAVDGKLTKQEITELGVMLLKK